MAKVKTKSLATKVWEYLARETQPVSKHTVANILKLDSTTASYVLTDLKTQGYVSIAYTDKPTRLAYYQVTDKKREAPTSPAEIPNLILNILGSDWVPLKTLVDILGVSRSGVAFAVQRLESAGLLSTRKDANGWLLVCRAAAGDYKPTKTPKITKLAGGGTILETPTGRTVKLMDHRHAAKDCIGGIKSHSSKESSLSSEHTITISMG